MLSLDDFKQEALAQLLDLLRIPSISTLPETQARHPARGEFASNGADCRHDRGPS